MQHSSGEDWRGVVTHLFSNGLKEGASNPERLSAENAQRHHQALADYVKKLVETTYLLNFLPTGNLGLRLCQITWQCVCNSEGLSSRAILLNNFSSKIQVLH